jgi:ABC-type Co2+ transport system permease subunit
MIFSIYEYRTMMTFDINEIITRLVKYVVEGLAVGLAAQLIARKGSLKVEEVVLLGLVAAAVFAILDLFAPSVGYTARQGAGFGVGARLVGFPQLA